MMASNDRSSPHIPATSATFFPLYPTQPFPELFYPPSPSLCSAGSPFPPSGQPNTLTNQAYCTQTSNIANLGKDGDLFNVRREVCSLIDEVNSLIAETEVVFAAIERIHCPEASPIDAVDRLSSLLERYTKLANTLRLSGLGALPADVTELYDIPTLLEAKQAEVQALYRERQRRREGPGIVIGVLEAASTEPASGG